MATLMPWTTVEIGDVNVFAPTLPALIVYTWYVDGVAESSVTYFWRDELTGAVQHELLFVGPVAFDEAVSRAQEEAPKRKVERIHVKHARSPKPPVGKAKSRQAAKPGVQSKRAAGSRNAKPSGRGRRPSA